ncbi:MAG: transcription termination/antitermination protein NusG [Thermoanaerobaculia bacterium]
MAILKREPEIFPEGLFDLETDASPWWVARVKSRHEKALARHLLPFEVPFYLPQSEQVVRRGNRSFTSYLPLFSGYVFFRGSRSERLVALQSQVVSEILEVRDQDRLEAELLQLRRLQLSGASLIPLRTFAPGEAVVVTDGPFRGYEGVVVRDKGRTRLIVSISLLRKAVAVELSAHALAPSAIRRSGSSAAVA